MRFQPTKYDKSKAKASDFFVYYCDHRGDCDRKCEAKSTAGLKKPKKEDVAYSEPRRCDRFRPHKGVVEGADIVETGIWR